MKTNRLIKVRTLRGRLTALYLAVLVVALGLFTALLHGALETTLYRHHDPELAMEAARLLQALAGPSTDGASVAQAINQTGSGSQFVMVRSRQGDLLYQSAILETSEPNIGRHEVLVHAATTGSLTPQFFTARLEHWGVLRFICLPIANPPRAYLQIGMPLGDINTTRQHVMTVSLILIPIVLALMSAGGWVVAGRALSPIRTIDDKLRSIQATDLSRRIDVDPADAELAGLVATLNQLLARLETSFVSIRQFAADVSHQLQTPLTVMKGNLELLVASSQTPSENREALMELGEEVDDMAAVLADLRTLSLADSGPAAGQRGPVDLSTAVREAAELLEALAESKEVSLDASIQSGLTVWGSAVSLKQIVLNLGENAVKYTHAGGRVGLELYADDHEAVLRVSDTGTGIPPANARRIFERFYRVADGDAHPVGAGLGLAIVKRIVDAHGGSIQVDSRPGQGSAFIVQLPLVSA